LEYIIPTRSNSKELNSKDQALPLDRAKPASFLGSKEKMSRIGQARLYGVNIAMPISAHRQLHDALRHDLNKSDSTPPIDVVDDFARKIFTARKNGAILEFPHKQPDGAFWSGAKYYSSGTWSKVRFPRTQREVVLEKVERPKVNKKSAKH